jgi:protein-L-isoaspartate(D-aspartate) O-methyltransferase
MIDLNLRRDLIAGLRRAGVDDERVLAAMEAVPRDLFVPQSFGDQSYQDTALPIDCGQTISQPFVVAAMTAILDVGPRMKVLEVGTGSGYQAAVLSRLCRRVYTIERFRKLLRQAEARFKALDLHNVTTRFGDGMKGWPEQAPFDRIIVTAGAEEVPRVLLDQLKADGGIMVIPAGEGLLNQRLLRIRRSGEAFETRQLDSVRFVPLLPGTVDEEP